MKNIWIKIKKIFKPYFTKRNIKYLIYMLLGIAIIVSWAFIPNSIIQLGIMLIGGLIAFAVSKIPVFQEEEEKEERAAATKI